MLRLTTTESPTTFVLQNEVYTFPFGTDCRVRLPLLPMSSSHYLGNTAIHMHPILIICIRR